MIVLTVHVKISNVLINAVYMDDVEQSMNVKSKN